MDRSTFSNTYQNLQQLASGGTGVVYRAYHANLGKHVILKRAKVGMNPAMLRREVDILKNLRHRYLPVIYDYISVENMAFVVEDFIDGWDLNEYITRGIRPEEEEVVRWLRQLCEVLEYLHTRTPEIIHSDIKPGNIMVDRQGDVCLIDFNISILLGKDKTVMGYSNYYCAPEQREQAEAVLYGKRPERVRIDSQTDIYSLSATFYTLLSGVVPDVTKKNKPLTKMKLPYSEGLCTILDKGMERERSKRIRSARQMLKMLNHMEHMTAHFRRYVLAQSAVAVLGAAMLVIGAACLVQGSRVEENRQMQSIVRSVCSDYEQCGGSADVERKVQDALNQGQLFWDEHHWERAQMLAILGECQFETETQAGYQNAAEYYKQALTELEKGEPDPEATQEYALNCAAALFQAGRSSEVSLTLAPYVSGAGEEIILAMDAQEAYEQGEYAKVLELSEQLWNSQSKQETKAVVSRLAVKAALEQELWDEAAEWCERCLEADWRDESRRKVAGMLIQIGDARKHFSDYQAAEEACRGLKEWTQSDYLTHAEILYRMNNYGGATAELERINTSEEALLCRRSYLMSACALAQGEDETATEWCKKCTDSYKKLTDRQKNSVDYEALTNLCQQLGMEEEMGR